MENTKCRGGCPCCPRTKDILSMSEILYYGFGGYEVFKNGELFYRGKSDIKWEKYKTLRQIENQAKKEPGAEWVVELNNPLRGGKWKRNNDGQYILFETNIGFA